MLGRLVFGITGIGPTGSKPSVSDEFHAVFASYEVLAAIARAPGASSREICEAVSGSEGDSRRLLDLLEELELVRHTGRFPDAWHLASEGAAVVNARTRMDLQQQQQQQHRFCLTAIDRSHQRPLGGTSREASK